MPDIERVGDLEIDQDLDIQRRNWAVERVGWGILAFVALAALVGLFGSGMLSNATVGSKKAPLWLEYERFGRFQAPLRLRVHLGQSAGGNGKVRVLLKRDYLENFQIQQVTPQPQSVEAGAKQLTYVFQVTEPNQPTAVTFYLQAEQVGLLSAQVGLPGKQPLHFSQFIYP
ncbi:hypothetical protein [Scytonema sp. PCC 10023]|uniref:hypothetical protein n=1 Tax=Scytonema sp. PCC 10023 TaxID=1680591 RepID=UPI0039C66C08